jgi:glyoxylase-like metal-dependent hydrolase (beta-lactamase superfamily II)
MASVPARWASAGLLATAPDGKPGKGVKPPLFLVLALCLSGAARSQDRDNLPNYAPLLPQVRAAALTVDPQKGYLVKELKPGVFMVIGGGYESLFVTTGKGVVLFDAPPTIAPHLIEAVADVTREPIVELVYSHVHVDHIGGAGLLLKRIPNLQIIAEDGTAEFLREQHDPNRPEATRTFKGHETLHLGSIKAELKVGYWHSPEGDLCIYLPEKKVLMAIDALSEGAVPFMGLDLTMNMDAYLKVFDQLLAYDFDVLVPGHHTNPATREDVQITKDYVMDVYNTVTRILGENHKALISRAVQKYGSENSFAVASVLIDSEVDQCADEIKGRWIAKLEGVDVWAASHCRTALVYAEWDVGQRAPVP